MPGQSWQQEIARELRASGACAVLICPHGLGDWVREELEVAEDRAAKDRRFWLFMVLLPGALNPDDPSLDFLANRTWVDLCGGITDGDGFGDLISAITAVPRRTPCGHHRARSVPVPGSGGLRGGSHRALLRTCAR